MSRHRQRSERLKLHRHLQRLTTQLHDAVFRKRDAERQRRDASAHARDLQEKLRLSIKQNRFYEIDQSIDHRRNALCISIIVPLETVRAVGAELVPFAMRQTADVVSKWYRENQDRMRQWHLGEIMNEEAAERLYFRDMMIVRNLESIPTHVPSRSDMVRDMYARANR